MAKLHDTDGCVQILDEMESNGVWPSMQAYEAVISELSESENYSDRTIQLLDEMKSLKFRPSVETYSSIIAGYIKKGDAGKVPQMMEDMKLYGYQSTKIYVMVITKLIQMKEIARGKKILRDIKDTLPTKDLATIVFSLIKSIFTQMDETQLLEILGELTSVPIFNETGGLQMEEFFEDLKSKGVQKVDTKLYNALWNVVSRKMGVNGCHLLLNDMISRGVRPNFRTCVLLKHFVGHLEGGLLLCQEVNR